MKNLFLAMSILLACTAQADSFCGYKDYFHLSASSNPAITVISGFSESSVALDFVGRRSFILRDPGPCKSGYAHVTIGYDPSHWCVLDIKDGPYMNSPSIQVSCYGMAYKGISYDGFGSYSYSLNLE